jgi:predicted hotdog family 3-hydroxylacyl-ACP dehydratase
MLLGRDQIAALIPHEGTMCLLDGVLHWDTESIRCVSARHRSQDNPLRGADGLGGVCGIEFAAQAMVVHGQLAGGIAERATAGYLAGVRDVHCRQDRLDLLDGELIIAARRLVGDAQGVIYEFTVDCAGIELLSGRAVVMLDIRPQ